MGPVLCSKWLPWRGGGEGGEVLSWRMLIYLSADSKKSLEVLQREEPRATGRLTKDGEQAPER